MRFVVAIVAFVLAAAAIGLGVAQRTVLAGPSSVSSAVETGNAALTVIDGETLNANAGVQSIEVAAEGDIVLGYGSTADVRAWVGDAAYNLIGWNAERGELTSTVVRGTEPAAELPSPAGSDLWLREFTGTDVLTRKVNAPEGISVLIAVENPEPVEGEAAPEPPAEGETEGEDASGAGVLSIAPVDLTITWPLDTSAPTSGPLVVAGIALLLLGLAAFLWALVHARSRRGPRRNTPKLPKRPKPPQLKPDKRARRGATPELEAGPSRSSGRRRAFTATGLVAAAALVLAGCTAASEQPTPGASPTPDFATAPVVVTEGQLARILVDAAATVADADEAKDPALAAERLTGAALDLRTANYTIRDADSAVAPLAPIPDEVVEITLPQQGATWPRSVFAVTRESGVSPVGLLLTQASPRENYRIAYAVTLISTVPDVAPAELGAPPLPPGNNLGRIAPDEVAAAYGDVLLNGDESEYAELFQAQDDTLREAIGAEKKAQRKAELPGSASIEYSNGPGDDPVFSFGTNDTGQIVAVSLEDVETVRPTEPGAAVNPSGQVKALSGKTQSTRGIVATYGVQLLFYVPSVRDTAGKLVLLGYAHGLVSAVEVG